jgi:hypothetical protein
MNNKYVFILVLVILMLFVYPAESQANSNIYTNVILSNPQSNKPKGGAGKVFKITPKKIKRTNGTVLTPEMSVIVTLKMYTSDPFYNGAKEIKEAYMQTYGFDYKKANCGKGDFNFSKLD